MRGCGAGFEVRLGAIFVLLGVIAAGCAGAGSNETGQDGAQEGQSARAPAETTGERTDGLAETGRDATTAEAEERDERPEAVRAPEDGPEGERTAEPPRETEAARESATTQEGAVAQEDGQEDEGAEDATRPGAAPEEAPDRQQQQQQYADGQYAASEEVGGDFTAAPEASGGEAGAADALLDVRFGAHEGYERAVFDFGLGDAPAAGVPAWYLSSPSGEGNARVYLPGVTSTSVTDGVFGGNVMDRYYVVRDADGSLFVDVYSTGAFRYRVEGLGGPGRLVLDYAPSVSELAYPQPVFGERTVVTSPRTGSAVGSSLTVSGYSRNFEAQNTIQLVSPAGEVLAETTATSSDWAETWGLFEATLQVPPFAGEALLRVGTRSARDGSFDGVEVPVTYGG